MPPSPVLRLVLLLSLVDGTAAAAAPPVWKVRLGAGAATLLGSVHLLPPTTDWLTSSIRADLLRADRVVFEAPQTPEARAAAEDAADRRGRLPLGVTLRGLLQPPARQALEALLRADGAAPDALDRDAPWWAETELSLSYLTRQGAFEAFGVEAQIMRMLRPGARVDAFETAEEEVTLLADMPLSDQIASLNETVRELREDPDAYARLEDAYLSGDVDALRREAVAPLREHAPGAWRRLVQERNLRWGRTLMKLLRRGGRIFVVVGVGHLLGPDGLPALLRAQGVTVEGP